MSGPRLRYVAAALLLLGACTRPVPGVLTLAPAGMRLNGACTPHPDGTLAMAVGATAESDVYVDASPVTIAVTAAKSQAGHPLAIELWFDGARVGQQEVQSLERIPIPFHASPRASGPVSLRLAVRDASGSGGAETVEVEKIVITQP